MQTITATNARSNWFQILKQILKNKQPTRVSTKNGAVIMMSEEEFEGLMETTELLAIPGLKESIQKSDEEIAKGETYSMEDVFND